MTGSAPTPPPRRMKTTHILTTTAALAATALTAACGTSHPANPPGAPQGNSAPASAQPVTRVPASGAPDGVKILTRAGVSGAYPNGQDVYGDTMSEGKVPGPNCTGSCGEDLMIYTNADQAALNTNLAQMLSSAASPGGDVIITGPRYILRVSGVMNPATASGNPVVFYLDPATIAKRIGGTIVTAAPSPAGSPS
jgi:hypothetical protein